MAKPTVKTASPADQQRQKLWKELALVAIAPILLYLLASLFTYATQDPGWSRTDSLDSLDGSVRNIGGLVGAYIADVSFWLFGYMAYSIPVVLAGVAWIGLFGLDSATATSISGRPCA